MLNINSGRHFLQIPGPTNVPNRILNAINKPTIDHRGPEFKKLILELLQEIKKIFKTKNPVIIYSSSGTGAWEAALVNTHSPGDKTLMYDTGYFANTWKKLAIKLGLEVQIIAGDWRHGTESEKIEQILKEDRGNEIKSVCIVHNETSTGITSNIPKIRKVIDSTGHRALLIVDTISSLASIDYEHDKWGVDVTIGGSQKGLMLPPGLSFNAVSEKALKFSKKAKFCRSYWDWQEMINSNDDGLFPYTPSTNLLFGLKESIHMLLDEGLENVFLRHLHLAEATRTAVKSWGLEINALNPDEYSNSLTTVLFSEGFKADNFRKIVLENFNVSLGNGLGRLNQKAFRIGHLGYFNEPMLIGTLGAIEMGLEIFKIPISNSGTRSAIEYLFLKSHELVSLHLNP